ncbi:MAG: acylphosphatase [Gemmatimonadota bacterium]|nr:MAG: acylphosphatase [Gemmatimonadota bacterium]
MYGKRQCFRWLISGRVQGVGFRWFVVSQAEQFGIAGWTRNLPDGRVEVVGSGAATALAEFERAIGQGPRISRVENVEKVDCPPEVAEYKSFHIR